MKIATASRRLTERVEVHGHGQDIFGCEHQRQDSDAENRCLVGSLDRIAIARPSAPPINAIPRTKSGATMIRRPPIASKREGRSRPRPVGMAAPISSAVNIK